MSAPLPREPGVTYETKVMNLIVQDRADKKKYERMLSEGWEVEDVQKRTLLRGATYSFRRPTATSTPRLDAFVAGADKVNAGLDKMNVRLEAWNKKMEEKAALAKAERQAKKEAKRTAKDRRNQK